MIKHFLLATLAGLSAFSVQAAKYPWYEVEVYLFQRQANTDEHWPSTPLTLKTSNALDLITPQVSNDITGVSMALGGDCGQNSWNTVGNSNDFGLNTTEATTNQPATDSTQQPCHGLNSANKLLMPKQIPVEIVPADATTAAQESAVLLADDKAQFNDYIARLNHQGDIQPLLHMTWQQQMKPRRAAQPMHLFAGKDFAEQFQANGMPVSMEAKTNHYGFSELSEQNSTPTPVWQFDGLLTIYLNHYLYVETRFNLREPEQKTLDGDALAQTQPTVIPFLGVTPMEQNRRIRSTEIHYFDHPKMGMLLQVRKMVQPVEVPPEDDEQQDDVASESTTPDVSATTTN